MADTDQLVPRRQPASLGEPAAPRDALEREPLMPAVSALRAFVMTAQYRNFSRAAEELGITQSGVSRAVRSVEQLVGLALFERTGHGLVLTEPGVAYLEEVRSILADLAAATLRLSTYKAATQPLHIATLPSLGALWLAPRLAGFARRHPTIALTVTAQHGPFDIEAAGVDAVIYYGSEAWSGGLSDLLMAEELLPLCSPQLAARLEDRTPALLTELSLIQHTHRPTAWREWFKEVGLEHPRVAAGPRFEQYHMGIRAAVGGLGAVLMPRFLVGDELAAGRLVALHDRPVRSAWAYYLAYPETKRTNPCVQRFRSWLRAEARRSVIDARD